MGYRQFLDFAPGGSPGAFRTNYACVVDRVVRGVGWIGHVIQGTGGMRNVNHSTVLHNIVPVLSLSRGRGPSINNRRPGTNIYHKGRVGWCAVKNVVKVVVNVIIFVGLVRVISNIVSCVRVCLPGSPGHLGLSFQMPIFYCQQIWPEI